MSDPPAKDMAAKDMAAPDAAALVRAIAGGDKRALGKLYDAYGGLLLAIGTRIIRDRTRAEDILHDVFLEVWKKAHTYDAKRASVRSWLLLRMRSRCIDHVKSAAVSRRRALAKDLREAKDDPERAVDAGRIGGLLATLPPEQRDVLVLGYFRGLSSREIAAELDIPIGTVKSRIAGGLKKLRASVHAAPTLGGDAREEPS